MKKLFGALVAMGAMVLMAVGVQAATYSAGVASPEAGFADIPVIVTPDEGQSESVNGYVMTLTYDSTKVTPQVVGTDVADGDAFATVGEDFADGVLVSGVVESASEGNNETLAVAWASDKAVTVDDASILATVKFLVDDSATGDVPINVAVTALTNDGNELSDTFEVGNGEITIDAEDFLRGDANGDGNVDSTDATLILQSLVDLNVIEEENRLKADANADNGIDSTDATLILQSLVGLNTIPQ